MVDLPFTLDRSSLLPLIAHSLVDQVSRVWEGCETEYVLASDRRRHTWNAWLNVKAVDGNDPNSFYDFLTRSRAKAIVADAFGYCPPGMTKALGKLGAQARRPDVYANLFKLLSTGGRVARLVHHMKTIDDDVLVALASLPDDPATVRLINRLLQSSVHPKLLNELVWAVTRLRQILPQVDVDHAIVRFGEPITAIRELVTSLPFPGAPWVGDGNLQPIETFDDLVSFGYKLANCLRDKHAAMEAALSVQSGKRYYYSWNGAQPALISFTRAGVLGWVFREAWGIENQSLTLVTLNEIRLVLLNIDALCPVNLDPKSRSMFSHLVGFMSWIDDG